MTVLKVTLGIVGYVIKKVLDYPKFLNKQTLLPIIIQNSSDVQPKGDMLYHPAGVDLFYTPYVPFFGLVSMPLQAMVSQPVAPAFATNVEPADVPAEAIFKLGLVVGVMVPLLYLIPISMVTRYRITRARHAEIKAALTARRLEAAESNTGT